MIIDIHTHTFPDAIAHKTIAGMEEDIVNIKGNISTIHSYNRRKVKEEDIPKYGKAVGTGTLIIGISLVLGFIVSFWSEEIMGFIILPAVIVGLGFMLYGQIKYNKGIF